MIAVLGLGNVLLQDDGLGVMAAQCLASRYRLPEDVQVVDGGTLGLELLPLVEDVDALLVVDAVETGAPPGTLIRLAGEEIPAAVATKMSMHQANLQDLLAVGKLRGTLPERVVLWGLAPGCIEWGLEPTPAVAARLDELVEAVAGELGEWGVVLIPM